MFKDRKVTYQELLIENQALKKELEKYTGQGFLDSDVAEDVDFFDLFNVSEIQKIQDLFAEATGVASIITYPDGVPITKPSNFCRLCKDIIRKTEKGKRNCYYSDAVIGKQNEKGAVYQPCLSGGLWDAGASISIGGKHLANWLIGQVKNEDTDLKKMLEYAKEIGVEEDVFQKALDEVTVMPTEKFKRIADVLFLIANEISNKAYQNIRLTDFNRKLQEKEKLLVKAKEKAEDNERQLRESQIMAKMGSWELDMEKGIFTFNDNFYSIFHTNVNEVGGYELKIEEYAKKFVHPDEWNLVENEVRIARETNDPDFTQYIEHKICYADGGTGYIGVKYSIVKDINGNTIKTFGVNQDITERKKTEQELILAKDKAEESSRLITEFFQNMSHEIRTPMNGILGFSEILIKPGLSDEKKKYYSKIVQNCSYQLLRIIDDLLQISALESKQEQAKEEILYLNDVLMELFSIFNLKSKERNIPLYLKKSLVDSQSLVISDKSKLNKILGNLLENAFKFTHEGFIELGYNVVENRLHLYVKDTGIGISENNHAYIFERFSQENNEIKYKHGGLGLGLSIAKANAQLCGGDITVVSEKGKGSTFVVSLPYRTVHPNPITESTPVSFDNSKIKHEKRFTLLVAEDEEVNYIYIETLLYEETELNFNLVHAKNGKEACDICFERSIDLILMDIKMPVMNGYEATEKIKEKFPELPIIAQTAYSTESDKNMALQHGFDGFISKPLNKEDLFVLLKKYLITRK